MNEARPYAIAAFEYARDHSELPAWRDFLAAASAIATDPNAILFLSNPKSEDRQVLDLFFSILQGIITKEMENFIRLLQSYKRLRVLPKILDIFESQWEAFKRTSTIRVVSAVELSDDYKKLLVNTLSKQLSKTVSLECQIDSSLIGGAIIYIGDTAIDGSIRGKLNRMLQNLTE